MDIFIAAILMSLLLVGLVLFTKRNRLNISKELAKKFPVPEGNIDGKKFNREVNTANVQSTIRPLPLGDRLDWLPIGLHVRVGKQGIFFYYFPKDIFIKRFMIPWSAVRSVDNGMSDVHVNTVRNRNLTSRQIYREGACNITMDDYYIDFHIKGIFDEVAKYIKPELVHKLPPEE